MLLTVKDVSNMLQVSGWYVYKHFKKLGGFYLPGGKLLRFREEKIYE